MTDPKNQREHEAELIIGVGSQGTAAMALTRNLLLSLRSSGVFSDIELSAIFDATFDQVRGGGDPISERFAESVRQAIRQVEESVLKEPRVSTKH